MRQPPVIDVRYEEQRDVRRAYDWHVWSILGSALWTLLLALGAPVAFASGNLVLISLGALGAALTLAACVTGVVVTLNHYRTVRRRFIVRWGHEHLPD